MKLYEIAARNVLRNKRRSILSGVAIAISVMVILFYGGFINGIIGDMKKSVFGYVSGHVKIENADYDKNAAMFPLHLGVPNYQNLIQKIDRLDEVLAAAPRIPFGTLIYGSPRIGKLDIKDMTKLVQLLRNKSNPAAVFIMGKLPERVAASVSGATLPAAPNDGFVTDLIDSFNEVIRRYNLYKEGLIGNAELTTETMEMLSKPSVSQDTMLVNRFALEDAYPELIEKSPRFGKTFGAVGYGVDFEREKAFMDPGGHLVDGALPAPGTNGMLLSIGLAEKMRLAVGDKLTIFTKTSLSAMNAMTFRVSGIVKFPVFVFNQKSFFLPLDSAMEFLQMDNSVTDIIVLAKDERVSKTLAAKIGGIVADTGIANVVSRPWEESAYVYNYVQITDIAYSFMALFFFLLGTSVIINTTMMVIYERIREIGTVSAMGMTGGEITRLFFIEAFIISAVSAAAGIVLGLAILLPLGQVGINVEALMRGVNMDLPTMIYPSTNLGTVVFVYLYAVVVASLVSLVPSRRASKIEPVEALKSI